MYISHGCNEPLPDSTKDNDITNSPLVNCHSEKVQKDNDKYFGRTKPLLHFQ